jgi:phosphoribosylformimino-5-aminoimidazole carboxamide ribotide isomerase
LIQFAALKTNEMQIIPAIDLRAGRCVRLRQGNYDEETVFGDDPAAMAEHWVALGAERLHLVDLDGARDGHPSNVPSVRAILDRVRVPCQLGGGVRSTAAVAELLGLGLDRVIVGTRAVTDTAWFEKLCGDFPQKICLGLDARDGKLAMEGWTHLSTINTLDLARRFDGLPLAAIIYTDISRDGMMGGVNLRSVEELVRAVRAPVIASGGVTVLADLTSLAATGVVACIIGRALYEKSIALPDAIRAANEANADGSS